MPRNNRNTVKVRRHRDQKSKRRIGDLAYVRALHPRFDERGAVSLRLVVDLGLILAMSATFLGLALAYLGGQ